jgi:hypothetical protein
VGANDPQMFAQVFFLGGLLIYVSGPPTLGTVAAVAFLFVLGGNVKHNLIDFPLAVFLDLCLLSRRRAFQFLGISGILAAVSVAIHTRYGGPFFVYNILAGRSYSVIRALLDLVVVYLPIFLPLIAAGIWAMREMKTRSNRALALFFFTSLFLGFLFGGGEGVSTNAYFDNFLAISIIVGILFHSLPQTRGLPLGRFHLPRWAFAAALFACLFASFWISGNAVFWGRLADLPREQARFDQEVSFLARQPGPAICESLLRCYAAGKEYVYDPFNSQRFVRARKLDAGVIAGKIAAHEYAAIQIGLPVKSFEQLSAHLPRAGFHPVSYSVIQMGPFGEMSERFPETILQAIEMHYVLSVDDPECAIYVPKPENTDAPRSGLRR